MSIFLRAEFKFCLVLIFNFYLKIDFTQVVMLPSKYIYSDVTEITTSETLITFNLTDGTELPVGASALTCALLGARYLIPCAAPSNNDDDFLCGPGSVGRKRKWLAHLHRVFRTSNDSDVIVFMPGNAHPLPIFGFPESNDMLRRLVLQYMSTLGVFTVTMKKKLYTLFKAFYVGRYLDFLCFEVSDTPDIRPLVFSRLAKKNPFNISFPVVGRDAKGMKRFCLTEILGPRIVVLPKEISKLATAFVNFQQQFVCGVPGLLRWNNPHGNQIPVVCPQTVRCFLGDGSPNVHGLRCQNQVLSFFPDLRTKEAFRCINIHAKKTQCLREEVVKKLVNTHRHAQHRRDLGGARSIHGIH